MRITRVALAFAACALAAGGWLAPTTTQRTAAAGRPLTLAELPLNLGYVWAQAPAWVVTTPMPLTLAQLPLLTTYPWAQPDTAPQHVLHGEPWSL
jgi:hypothetical protein